MVGILIEARGGRCLDCYESASGGLDMLVFSKMATSRGVAPHYAATPGREDGRREAGVMGRGRIQAKVHSILE